MVPLYGLGIVALIVVLLWLKPTFARARRWKPARGLAILSVIAAVAASAMTSPKLAAAGLLLVGILAALSRLKLAGSGGNQGPGAPGGNSAVGTPWLEAYMDHDTGRIGGRIRQGEFVGERLEAMPLEALLRFRSALESDLADDSLRLLDTFLDQDFPGWGNADGAAGRQDPGDETGFSGAVGREEALKILGLEADATDEEIRAAHRRLIGAVHPDKGGSSYLAAQLNRAKEVLLG